MTKCPNERNIDDLTKARMCKAMNDCGVPKMIHLAVFHTEIGLEVFTTGKKSQSIQYGESPCGDITYIDAHGGETPETLLNLDVWEDDLDGFEVSGYLIHSEAPELSRQAAETAVAGGWVLVVRCPEENKDAWAAFLSPRADVIYRERPEGNLIMRQSLG